ncbi:hypothetical protein L3049_18825 [Labilibaculum sp. DW002]|jgi:hypothetical protein|uniref:Uncharacterized protein n=1 Tax=Paralabilibaculum antarcticum TaxID=2912572 RepID=A0ABT5VX99_9BACT|nr:hypothetical protein [Labilibaculum sp. DW002]MDE5420049.1 hypothetical protein [Labilibaculum sp. DW002]
MDLISLIVIVAFLGGIIVVLKNGFNENTKGLESLDQKLKMIEEKIAKTEKKNKGY